MISATFAAVVAEFYATSKRYPYQVYGEFEKREIPLILPRLSPIILPPELEYFYSNFYCDAIFSHKASFTLFEDLKRRQEGFSSSSTDFGKTMQPDPTWNKNWTVFADVNDDPLVTDAGTAGAPVYAAIEGVDYEEIAPSVEMFFIILIEMMKVFASFADQRPEDDLEEQIRFDEEFTIPATLKRFSEIVDAQHVKALAHFFYS